MLGRALVGSRYIVLIAIVGTFAASLALLVYEAIVVATAVVGIFSAGDFSSTNGKTLALGVIEAVDVFLIAIVVYMISLGLYSLFVDDSLPLPRWLEVHDLDDLKSNLISLVIAVLAVIFLREVFAWDGQRDIFSLGVSLALVVAALTFYLKSGDLTRAAKVSRTRTTAVSPPDP